jgi:2-polyprenyl-3-methyl-5-hydroxy-6-metoxy-1,4-benzoquinol methylase
MRPAEESPWLPIYKEAAAWINPGHPVVDLGCGTGRFAVTLARSGHSGGYTGIDFAPRVLAEAQNYLNTAKPHYQAELRQDDLTVWQPADIRQSTETYVALEVLEHIDDDTGLIARIPGGHRFIFSVPNYGSTAHVRRFPAPQDVWDRFDSLLSFRRWTLIDFGGGKAVHLLDTTRRIDSWR